MALAIFIIIPPPVAAADTGSDSPPASSSEPSAPPRDPMEPYYSYLHLAMLARTHPSPSPIPDSPLLPPPPCIPSDGLSPEANKVLGRCMLYTLNHISMLLANRGHGEYWGWGAEAEWGCLDRLWGPLESWWNQNAANRGSSAHGIAQLLPGSKAGNGWAVDVTLQTDAGLHYVRDRFGSPCAALSFRLRRGFY